MPAKDFKFISPGIFINEIDNSQLPREAGDIGPAIIGRTQQGPGLIPTRVNSFQEFVEVFGPPSPGGNIADVSRDGGITGPTYGAYAAQAWLRNNSPVTFVRLVGQQHSNATEGSGEAGWQTTNTSATPGGTSGGAYGLFVFESSSAGISETTGTLAAIWYCNTGSVALTGTLVSASATGLVDTADIDAATNKFVKATGNREFKVIIKGNNGTTRVETKFNFDNSSENFIRKVFNTDPTLTNSAITNTNNLGYTDYWLGETYEDEVKALLNATNGSRQYGVMIPLQRGDVKGGDVRRDYNEAATGYFISQDTSNNPDGFDAVSQQKLFRIKARNSGLWASKNIKVCIADIRASADPANEFGTFSVLVRKMDDDDNRIKVLEQFNNCNLNPSSENFVARKIGDKYMEWDDDDRRYKEYGDYANNSDYIYVELDATVRNNKHNPESLPFGVYGPPRFLPVAANDRGTVKTLVTGGLDFYGGVENFDDTALLVSGGISYPVKFDFPSLRLRVSASEGNPTDPTAVYFGVDTTFNIGRPSNTIGEYTGPKPYGVSMDEAQTSGDAQTEDSFIFTLDDMCVNQADGDVELSGTLVYESGSRQNSATGGKVNIRRAGVTGGSYRDILDLGADRFTTVLHGGFDGLDITEAEPFRNSQFDSTTTQRDSYAFNSIKVAIDSLRDPENVEFDIVSAPGLTNNTLNRNLIDMAEQRGDALAVIDLEGGYEPETENTNTAAQRIGSVKDTINNKRNNLQINSSFGCAYYPWVQIQDTINGALLWAPPSVAAIGAMSYGQRTQELWFAPAGFTRGGLSVNGAAGLPVVGVRERLIARDRDKLYEANINPIAQFPAEGIVIFGQKTLQVTPSALDRINVRRLLIFLKKQISRFASTILFDQNVDVTWNRFIGQVDPFLASVKAGLGLEEYKLILDDTTTTPDLVDRNVVYAKIYLKPARSIEFIAVDFVITDSGAAFED